MEGNLFLPQLLHCCCLCLLQDRREGVLHDVALRVSIDSSLSWIAKLLTTATSNHDQTSKGLCRHQREFPTRYTGSERHRNQSFSSVYRVMPLTQTPLLSLFLPSLRHKKKTENLRYSIPLVVEIKAGLHANIV